MNSTQKLAREARVPAMATSGIVNMQPPATNGTVVREGEAIRAVRDMKIVPKATPKDDLSRFGRHD